MKTPIYSAEDEMKLMSRLFSKQCREDPLYFVMYVFPWGVEGTPLHNFSGPRVWQRRFLRKIADHISNYSLQEALGEIPDMMAEARASGRGIGKSALVSWVIIWFLTTRIGASVIVSANTEDQLRSVTWGELGKWVTLAVHSHWWEPTATKLVPAEWLTKIVERELKKGTKQWGAEGKSWREEKPDSYAGPHNHEGMMLIFDEASGIPNPIWSVGQGYFTEPVPNRFWFAFSNPRRNDGYFYDCFVKDQGWGTEQIDARTVEGTDKKLYENIISRYGEDSYEARVEVYGQFPETTDDMFISPSIVNEAVSRPRFNDEYEDSIMGIDPAGEGKDTTGIIIRQGRDVIYKKRISESDPSKLIDILLEEIQDLRPDYIAIDKNGLGWGLFGAIKKRYPFVIGVNGGEGSGKLQVWKNKRAKLWSLMKDWLKEGSIPNDESLKKDLTSVKRVMQGDGSLLLESKVQMKRRKIPSPDLGDALSMTFEVKTLGVLKKRKQIQIERKNYLERELLLSGNGEYNMPTSGNWMRA